MSTSHVVSPRLPWSSFKPLALAYLRLEAGQGLLFGLLLGLGLVLGCQGRGPSPAPLSTTKTEAGATTAASFAAPAPAPSFPSPPAGLTLAERLSREASRRSASALRPEDVKEALGRAGVALDGWQQVLGSTIGASFCMAGHTAQGLGVAICEYPDAATATRGLAYSRDTFDRLIPNRQLRLRRGTLLTLSRAPAPAPADGPRDEALRISTTFASL